MKHIKLIYMLFWIIISSFTLINAQENLEVDHVFKKYGMKEGAVFVELSTDVLAGNTRILFYKSLVTAENPEIEQAIMKAISHDTADGFKLLESVRDGQTETGYYCLKQVKQSKVREYILYKNKTKKITLIYLEGKFPPQDLEKELDKLKDLFIYVNKKRINLR